MPALPPYPMIRGARYDYAAITVALAGNITLGVAELSYKQGQEGAKQYGTSRYPISRTYGVNKPEGSISLYKAEAYWLIGVLQGIAGKPYMEQEFNMLVQYGDDTTPIYTDSLESVRLVSEDFSGTQGGNDALMIKFDLDIMLIRMNGQYASSYTYL